MNLGPLSIVVKGSHVKYFLRSGMVLEGIVEEDTAAQIVLRSLDGQSLMILHRPTEDILMTKVMLQPPAEEAPVEPRKPIAPSERQERVKEKLQEARTVDDPELQQKSIGELRQMVIDQERQMIAEKRREHFGSAGAVKMTQYTHPFMPRVHPRSNTRREK